MNIYLFFFRNNVLFHGRKITKIFKTKTNSSAPLDETTTSFWVCGSVYVNCIMFRHTIVHEFLDHSRTSSVSQAQRFRGSAPKTEPARVEDGEAQSTSTLRAQNHRKAPRTVLLWRRGRPLSHQTTHILTLQNTKVPVSIGDLVVETLSLSKCTKQTQTNSGSCSHRLKKLRAGPQPEIGTRGGISRGPSTLIQKHNMPFEV